MTRVRLPGSSIFTNAAMPVPAAPARAADRGTPGFAPAVLSQRVLHNGTRVIGRLRCVHFQKSLLLAAHGKTLRNPPFRWITGGTSLAWSSARSIVTSKEGPSEPHQNGNRGSTPGVIRRPRSEVCDRAWEGPSRSLRRPVRSARGRDRREDRWDHREDRRDRHEDRYDARNGYWDPARYYRRDDRRYPPRRLGRNDPSIADRITATTADATMTTGLIVGGIAGGVLGVGIDEPA